MPERPHDPEHDDDQSSDPVTRLLLDAFEMDVRNEPVDQDRLNAGVSTRRRRRRRTRRLQMAGAALVVAAGVPLAVQAWPTSTVSTTPASQSPAPALTQAEATAGPASPSPSTTPAPTSTPTAPPATSTSGLANPDVPVAYDIPDMTRAAAALPAGMSVLSDMGQYPKSPTVMGQECSSRPFDPPMVAGRQFTWVNEAQRWPRQEGVDLVVTGRATGGGPVAFDALVGNWGVCRFTEETQPFDLTIAGAEQTWAAQTDSQGLARVSGAARVGDLIVGVSIWYPQDGRAELAALLTAAVTDLQTSGLPAAEGR